MPSPAPHDIEINLIRMYDKYEGQECEASEILGAWYEGKMRESSCIDKLVKLGVTE